MKTISRNQTISYLILLFLLILNISESSMVLIHDDILHLIANATTSDPLANWVVAFYGLALFGSFSAIAVIIALNRDDMQKMNMDKSFVLLLLICGALGLYSLPYNCFSVIAFLYLVYAMFGRKIRFGIPVHTTLWRIVWIISIIASILFVFYGFLHVLKIEQNMNLFFFESVPFSVYEEAVYRGVLFMFLKDLELSEPKIIYIQAFLFWISHINYALESPVYFWIFIPVLGLILGYIALRSKSITTSSVIHILVNFFTVFVLHP